MHEVDYQLEPASNADRDWLDALRRSAYRGLFVATWGGWDEARHQRHFSTTWEAGHISIIKRDGRRVGMIQLLDTPERVEVAEIQVLPEQQSRGLGSRVLLEVMEEASRRDKPVSLSLGLKNIRAHRLYRQLGFEETGRSDTHIFMHYRRD